MTTLPTFPTLRDAARQYSDAELYRELAHARNARDAYSIGRVPEEIAATVSVLVAEQHSRRARRQLAAQADALLSRILDDEQTPPTYTAYRHYTGNSAYGPERWAIRATGQRDPVDFYRTQSGAEHAARMLNAGTGRLDRHAPIGCRVQPN